MRRSYALLGALLLALATVFGALAEPVKLEPFTESELATNWEGDRRFPTGNVTSVDAFGREDVARIGIDSAQAHPSDTFRRTEGIKTVEPDNFGDAVEVDLYVDPDWQDKAVRAGFWVVGSNGEGGRDGLFGIIEFVNNEPCDELDCSNQSNITDHEGWRIWSTDSDTWANVNKDFEYGQWYTLAIELDAAEELYNYYIDEEFIGTGPGGTHYIHAAFLNSYNYGLDNFPTLSNESYAAYWHAGLIYAVEGSTYTVCLSRYTGMVSSAPDGVCPVGSVELETQSTEALTFCINPYTSQVRFQANGDCPPRHRTHVVPDNGDLLTCVSQFTGTMRYVNNLQQCGRYELPNVIAAGEPTSQAAPPARTR